MSESKFTKGPWKVEYSQETGRPLGIYAPNDTGIPGAVGNIVRRNGIGLPSSETAQANAYLIASAPDLLEEHEAWAAIFGKALVDALQGDYDEVNRMAREFKLEWETDGAPRLQSAIIAKAKGESA